METIQIRTVSVSAPANIPPGAKKTYKEENLSKIVRESVSRFIMELEKMEQKTGIDLRSGKKQVTLALAQDTVDLIDEWVKNGWSGRADLIRCALLFDLLHK